MANLAAQNLSALMNLTQNTVQAVDTKTALENVRTQDATPTDDVTGDAEFGTPEAIAAGVIGSLIAGPVGGVLMAGATGWMKKRADQSMLDQIADEQNVMSDAAAVYDDVLGGFEETAQGNARDLEQIGVLTAQRTAAMEMMRSGSAAKRDEGAAAFAQFEQNLQGYAERQESQQIAKEAADAQMIVEEGVRKQGIYSGLQTDYDAQSDMFVQRQKMGHVVMNALESGNPADIHAAMIGFNKAMDPNSAVLGEERTAVEAMTNTLQKVYNIAGGVLTGAQIGTKQRREMAQAVERILQTSTDFQGRVDGEFMNRLDDAELDVQKYGDNFSLSSQIPTATAPPIEPDAGEVAEANITRGVGEARRGVETVKEGGQGILESIAIAGESFRENNSIVLGDAIDKAKAGVAGADDAVTSFLSELVRRGREAQTNRPTN